MVKILIIDDSPFTRQLLGQMVKMNGHEVIGYAEDGRQGVTLFKSLRPDLVTLDWLMPSKSGEAVLKKIIQLDPGARAFLEKSNVQRELLNMIDQVMAT